MKKSVFIFIMVSTLNIFSDQSQSLTDKIFVEIRYNGERKYSTIRGDRFSWHAKYYPFSYTDINTGTYWAINDDFGAQIFVTAAHVLYINTEKPKSIGGLHVDEYWKINSEQKRAKLGFLGFDVGDIGTIDGLQDVVFMRPKSKAFIAEAVSLSLAENTPKVLEEISIIGFPSTERQQIEHANITDVRGGNLTLNKVVDGGYSGAPVLNKDQQVYGLVINSSDRQTTVIRITKEHLSRIEWRKYSDCE